MGNYSVVSRCPRWWHLSLLLLAILPSLSAEPILWYKGIGADGKQPGERGMPDFTWTDNCFATSAYNSLYWFWLHGHDGMIPGGTSSTEDIENLWDDYMGGANANHGSMFAGTQEWINDHAPGMGWTYTYRGLQDSSGSIDQKWLRGGQFGYPSWDFYYNEIKRSEDVILLVDWASDGGRSGHAVTGAGVGNRPDTDRNWIAVSDPSDEPAGTPHDPDPPAGSWPAYQLKTKDGYLYIENYAVAGGKEARIYGMFAVSPVPEASSVLLVGPAVLVLWLVGLVGRRRNR